MMSPTKTAIILTVTQTDHDADPRPGALVFSYETAGLTVADLKAGLAFDFRLTDFAEDDAFALAHQGEIEAAFPAALDTCFEQGVTISGDVARFLVTWKAA